MTPRTTIIPGLTQTQFWVHSPKRLSMSNPYLRDVASLTISFHKKGGLLMDMYTRQENGTQVEGLQDEQEARNLLTEAFENTARWQDDFPGFSAHLRVYFNNTEFEGMAEVRGPKEVSVSLPDETVKKWVHNQLAMIAAHRVPRNFEQSDGKHILTLGPEDGHPLGRKLQIHGDGFDSYYRIKEGKLTQINRKMHQIAFTINVEESTCTLEGKYLTTKYTVYYRSPEGNELKNTESIMDTHVRVGFSDLPAGRQVISFENGDVVIHRIILEDHRLLSRSFEPADVSGCPVA